MRRHFGLLGILFAAFLGRLGTLRFEHNETDEHIYRALVEQVNGSFFNYGLHGTKILEKLDPRIYDYPVFFHPPVFVYLSWFLEKFLWLAFPLVPVLQSLITIAAGYFIALKIYKEEEDRRATALWTAGLLAICPLGWFLSQKFWIDTWLTAMVSVSVLAVLWALEKRGRKRMLLAGLVFALTMLTKYTAILLVPALAILLLQSGRKRDWFSLFLPAILACCGWSFLVTFANGVPQSSIVEWDPAKYPYMSQVMLRPFYYYLWALLSFSPIYLLAFFKVARSELMARLPLYLWAFVFFLGFTGAGLMQLTYQTRFVAPAYPALALLSAPFLAKFLRERRFLLPLGFLLFYTLLTGIVYGVWQSAEQTDFDFSVAKIVVSRVQHGF